MGAESLRSDLEKEGVTGAKAQRCLNVLRRIYIGQHIRKGEGVLQRDFDEFTEEAELLLEHNLIRENEWYNHELYRPTEKGSSVAKDLVRERLEEKSEYIEQEFDYSGEIISFLVFDYFPQDLSFPKHQNNIRHWMAPLLEDERVWQARNDLFEVLVDQGLCMVTHNYVSTRRGELREENYVICPEVRGYLQSEEIWTGHDGALVRADKKKCKAYQFLQNAPNFLDSDDVEKSRARLWEKLQEIGIEEDEFEDLVNKLSEDGATTQYRDLMSNELPFQIKSESKYQIALRNRLINPILADLLSDSSLNSPKNQEAEKLRKGEFPGREIELLETLAEMDHSPPFQHRGTNIKDQLEKAVDLYKDEHWSDCLSRIDNVCEDLVYELAIVRGEEFPSDDPLDQKYGGKIGSLRSASFVADPEEEYNSKFESLPHDLESIHSDRNLSGAPHGGENIVITEADVRRNIHLLADIYLKIEELLR